MGGGHQGTLPLQLLCPPPPPSPASPHARARTHLGALALWVAAEAVLAIGIAAAGRVLPLARARRAAHVQHKAWFAGVASEEGVGLRAVGRDDGGGEPDLVGQLVGHNAAHALAGGIAAVHPLRIVGHHHQRRVPKARGVEGGGGGGQVGVQVRAGQGGGQGQVDGGSACRQLAAAAQRCVY